MAPVKKITAVVKLQLNAGKATAGPPVGSSLGPHGINIPAFVKEFNEKTASQEGFIIPVEMTIYQDRSFTFVLKTPPAAVLIKKAIEKVFDLSVAGTIEKLDLKKPVYAQTAVGGHFGKDFLAWELVDKAEELNDAVSKG